MWIIEQPSSTARFASAAYSSAGAPQQEEGRAGGGGGRAPLPVLPCRVVRPQAPLELGRELDLVALLVRIGVGAGLLAGLEGPEAGGPHPSLLGEPRHLLDVDLAPIAARPARGEALHVPVLVDRVGAAVDPAEAERLVDRLGPAHRTLPGVLLVHADVDLGLGLVVLLEPVVELLGGLEEDRLRLAQTGITPPRLRPASPRASSTAAPPASSPPSPARGSRSAWSRGGR